MFVGVTSTITILLWILLTSNTPSDHRRISKREREYIVNSLKGEVADAQPTVYYCTSVFTWVLVVLGDLRLRAPRLRSPKHPQLWAATEFCKSCRREGKSHK